MSSATFFRGVLSQRLIDRCRSTHDIAEYLAAKPKDIVFNPSTSLSDSPPFVQSPAEAGHDDPDHPSLVLSTVCPVFTETGDCKFGLKCRFLGGHVQKSAEGALSSVKNEDRVAMCAITTTEVNFASAETLRLLRTRKVGRLTKPHVAFFLCSQVFTSHRERVS